MTKPGFYWARPRRMPPGMPNPFEPVLIDDSGLTWTIGSDEFTRLDGDLEVADEITMPEHLRQKGDSRDGISKD